MPPSSQLTVEGALIVPLVDEEAWREKLKVTPVWLPPQKPTVILAPHPDDETLAAGGLIAAQRQRGLPVTVIAVTDGEAAYQDYPELASVRIAEQESALKILGVQPSSIVRLELPDSNVVAHEVRLTEIIVSLLTTDTLLVAPWSSDWHPDHEACGRAAVVASCLCRAELMSYMFWTWHSKTIDSVPFEQVKTLNLDESLQSDKCLALAQHRSQLTHDSGSPILNDRLLAPARRPFESFLSHV